MTNDGLSQNYKIFSLKEICDFFPHTVSYSIFKYLKFLRISERKNPDIFAIY